MFKLLKHGNVIVPPVSGPKDILLCNGIIAAIDDSIQLAGWLPVEEYDLTGLHVLPGFLDQHIHLIGGGGEAGFSTRTPEVNLADITRWGITTVVGCLGTDGITRHLASLLAKVRALESEGITAYMYSGSYGVPCIAITGSIGSDIVLIDKVIGAGEIAISDHRSTCPSLEDLAKVAAESRVGGMIAGKAGIVHVHVGSGKKGLGPLLEVVQTTDIPIGQFVPTHVNRNPRILEEASRWGREGGHVDITSGLSARAGFEDAVKPAVAVRRLLEAGVPPKLVTMSSDGNGCMALWDAKGNLQRLLIASVESLYREFVDLVVGEGIPLDIAASIVATNPARTLKMYPRKGSIQAGSDADLVVLDKDYEIVQVWARGRLMYSRRRASCA
ncbi:MAG: beta-aspartyl-peptidase [Firmicutes bacterium]|nr:beta-aspartyl-peptidase [Bacillota bacterium]